MRVVRSAVAALGVLTAMGATEAYADGAKGTWDNWTNISLQYAYTWDSGNDEILGYGSSSDSRNQVRLEFERLWKYGEVYFFADWINAPSGLGGYETIDFGNFSFGPCCGEGDNNQIYSVMNANLSMQKVFGMQRGLIDVALEGRAGFSTYYDFDEQAIGASLYLNIPGIVTNPGDKIQFTYWRRWKDDAFTASIGDDRYADHNFWGITLRKEWQMFGLDWEHQTFFRYQQEEKGGPNETDDPDRIFWESEIFAHVTPNVLLGFRSEYFWNETGIIKDNVFAGEKDHWRPLIAVKVQLGPEN